MPLPPKPKNQTYGELVKQAILELYPWKPDVAKYLWERPLHGYWGPVLPSGALGETARSRRYGVISAGPHTQETALHELIHMTDPLKAMGSKKKTTKEVKKLISSYLEMFPYRFKEEKPSIEDILNVGLRAPKWYPLPPSKPYKHMRTYRDIPLPTESLLDFILGYPKSQRAEEFVTEGLARYGGEYEPVRPVYGEFFE